jgi:L-fuconolactonase
MQHLQVIDAHVHFWDPALLHYPWLATLPELNRPRLPSSYEPFAIGTTDAVVFVEANCAPDESRAEVAFVDRLAAHESRIAATVAFVDLLDAEGRDARLESLADSKRVLGIRQNLQGRPASLCRDETFVRGVQDAGGLGLTFDLCVTPDQLSEVAALVRHCPGTQFVLDHCGKPAIRDDAFEPWASALARVASSANVYCKLSGLFTEARPDQRHYDALRPYAAHALATFGPARLMYGSDWPVVSAAGGVEAWRAFTDRFTADWTPEDRRRFYGENAVRFYSIPVHAES